MSHGLNALLKNDVAKFFREYVLTTAYMTSTYHPRPPVGMGVSNFDLTRSNTSSGYRGAALGSIQQGRVVVEDEAIGGYWLPQGGYIDVPITNPRASFIFTIEFSGCKIYVDKMQGPQYRIFHIQCVHEHAEYPPNLRGTRVMTVDSRDYGAAASIDGPVRTDRIPEIRCGILLHYDHFHGWSIYLQGLTGIGPGIHGGVLTYDERMPLERIRGVIVRRVRKENDRLREWLNG